MHCFLCFTACIGYNVFVYFPHLVKNVVIVSRCSTYTHLWDQILFCLLQALHADFRLDYCRLWQALIRGDMSGVERYSRRLGAGDLYPLFACVLTARSWTSVNAGISSVPVTQSEVWACAHFMFCSAVFHSWEWVYSCFSFFFFITCCTWTDLGGISLHTKVGVAPVWSWPSGFHCAICAQRGGLFILLCNIFVLAALQCNSVPPTHMMVQTHTHWQEPGHDTFHIYPD